MDPNLGSLINCYNLKAYQTYIATKVDVFGHIKTSSKKLMHKHAALHPMDDKKLIRLPIYPVFRLGGVTPNNMQQSYT